MLAIADWLLNAAPSLLWGVVFVLVYLVFLAGVHSEARRKVRRFVHRRRALERVESWYPEERLVPVGLVAARSRLAAERRALEREGILRPARSSRRVS